MTTEDKIKLITLGQQLSTLGVETRMAQIGLKRAVDTYGMYSEQTAAALHQYQELASRFAQLEKEFLDKKEKYQK